MIQKKKVHSDNARTNRVNNLRIWCDDDQINSETALLKLQLSKIQHEHRAIAGRGAHLVASRIPADLENAAGTLIALDQITRLCAPDVHGSIKRSRS